MQVLCELNRSQGFVQCQRQVLSKLIFFDEPDMIGFINLAGILGISCHVNNLGEGISVVNFTAELYTGSCSELDIHEYNIKADTFFRNFGFEKGCRTEAEKFAGLCHKLFNFILKTFLMKYHIFANRYFKHIVTS